MHTFIVEPKKNDIKSLSFFAQMVGCDMVLDSTVVEDNCGVCNGRNDNCHTVQGTLGDKGMDRICFRCAVIITLHASPFLLLYLKVSVLGSFITLSFCGKTLNENLLFHT